MFDPPNSSIGDEKMKVTVKPLSPEWVDDFLYFFDQVAFSDNPDWASCYCYYYHIACNGKQWAKRGKEENRECAREFILSGEMNGHLAYTNGSPVGWCNANHKASYARLTAEKNLSDLGSEKVGSIVCFVIAPSYRRKGIARQLLEGACAGFKSKEYDYAEAYPRKEGLSDAQHYHGPLSMYKKAGFSVHKEFSDYFIVRKKL